METFATRLRAHAALIALAILLIAAPGAAAGDYTVDACQTPTGQRVLSTGGWEPRSGSAEHACEWAGAQYPGLYATWRSPGGHMEFRGWEFTAPAGTSIAGYELYRWYEGPTSGSIRWSLTTESHEPEQCGPPGCGRLGSPFTPPFSAGNRVFALGLRSARLRAGLLCVGEQGCPAAPLPGPRFHVMAARVRLSEEIPPRFLEPPSGTLLAPAETLTGEKSVSAYIADSGAGLAQAGLRIDGQDHALQAVDPDHPTCRQPYTVSVPCPSPRRVTLLFDTAALPNGPHMIRVVVRDAAGNETVSDPYAVVTRNGSRPNGDNAAPVARLRAWLPSRGKRRTRSTIGFRRRAALAGRLMTDDGRPIGRAVLDVFTKLDSAGAEWNPAGSVATDEHGRFHKALRPGPSRSVRIAYRAYTLDPGYSAVAEATLRVRTGVRLATSPRRVRNGSWITFRGRLLGRPGRRGVTVVIYAVGARVRGQRPRVPVEAVRTNRTGRFRYRYRFHKIAGPFHYRFQARTRPDRGYPYAPGRSRIAHVRARP
jgi:hypothetical protein